ncbi:MAG: hypothetical protein ACLFQ9_06920 [Desulfobacterales bacterium]
MTQQGPELKTAYTFKDFLSWALLALVPVLTAIHAISRASLIWTAVYIVVLAGCLLVVHRFFCTHCPHYKNTGRTTKCIFLWNFPAVFEPKTGAAGFMEKSATALAGIVAVAFPVYWLLALPILLAVYLLAWAVLFIFLNRYECIRCIYRECPMNRADDKP